ncbi:hypothetical protein QB607_003059 [Clostridium botulinum]|nr:hypothetical protein [Clostridium botulinum]EKS4395733.1 hypothetical protein [Clostridium botulinum]
MSKMLTWRDVLDSEKLKYSTFDQCRKVAWKVGYNYITFNGYVYSCGDKKMENPICIINNL